MTKESLIERMRHAATHCETQYDAEWEAKQMRDGADEIERLSKDAERYRWLREAHDTIGFWHVRDGSGEPVEACGLDAAIDAAMR